MSVLVSKLHNGLTVATQNIPYLDSATVGVWVKTGSRNELPDEHGLSHLLEHMAFKGTSNFSGRQIAEKIENIGGEINATTGMETTVYYTRCLKNYLSVSIEILADILSNPIFGADELKQEKHVIIQEIGASIDAPDDILYDYFTTTAYPNQSLGRSILGKAETVLKFTSKDLRRYMNQRYHSECMVVCASGSVDHDLFVKNVENNFHGYRPQQCAPYIEPAQYVGGDFHESRKLMDTQILIGFEGKVYTSPEFYRAQILSIILSAGMSSRLFQKIREDLGLCYSIQTFHWGFLDNGLFGIHTATQAEDLLKLMPALAVELRKTFDSITEKELNRAKTQYKSHLIMELESSSARAGRIARQILIYGAPLCQKELLNQIDSITVQEIQETACSIFLNSRPSVVSIGKKNKSISSEHFFDMLKK